MAAVTFYEKPGCAGNARQKALLIRSGHQVDARSLIAARWTKESLRPFFGSRPVGDWFNRAAPKVKSGEIDPDELNDEAALAALIADPLLIRRPLLRVGDRCEIGFDRDLIADWIGLRDESRDVGEACVRSSPATCEPPVDRGGESATVKSRGRTRA